MITHLCYTGYMNLWLVSPYHTGSHQAWAEGYTRYSHHAITLLTMAGRFWKWRMQGGAIELAMQATRLLEAGNAPDAILVTDMLNLPAWLGLLRGKLPAHVPIVLYMHENQLTYPWRPGEGRDLTYAMINWLSQLAADAVIFNSRYHHDAWFGELPNLLKHYPDYNHARLIDAVGARSHVLPVGIEAQVIASLASRRRAAVSPQSPNRALPYSPLILWNQRWEHDKRPDRFFALLYRLREADVHFRLAVAGENFRQMPAEFEAARAQFADVIEHWGYAESREAYLTLLARADLLISTADHEFFGISVLEAMAAGVFPILPARLSYPELISPAQHTRCLYTDEDDLDNKVRSRLCDSSPPPPELQATVLARFDWSGVSAMYDEFLAGFATHY
jgi:glycosyltransferase involved in cell wall biosynthesis